MTNELTIAEAAELAKVTRRLLQKHCAEGRIPARRFGKSWMITPEALAEFQARDRKLGPKFKKARTT